MNCLGFWKSGVVLFCSVKTFFHLLKLGGGWRTIRLRLQTHSRDMSTNGKIGKSMWYFIWYYFWSTQPFTTLCCPANSQKKKKKKKKHDHITPLLIELHRLPADFRIQFKLAVFAFQHFDGTLPLYLSSVLHTYQPCSFAPIIIWEIIENSTDRYC